MNEDLTSLFQSTHQEFWACIKLSIDEKPVGIVNMQREGDSLYIDRFNTQDSTKTEFACIYYNLLEDVRQCLYKFQDVKNVYVYPLYGFGFDMFVDSIKYLKYGWTLETHNLNEPVVRVNMVYNVTMYKTQISERIGQYEQYKFNNA